MKFLGLGMILVVLFLAVSSWVLIHILAVMGIFLAIAYPVWWLFAPRKSACFWCRAGQEGKRCLFCRKIIHKKEGVYPSNFSSAVFNGIMILLFSLVSLGIVLVESRVLFKLGFPTAPKTVSFVIPAKGQYRLGEVFPLKLEIVGIKTPINAVQVDLGFETDKLSVEDISTDGSFATIFVQKEINNNAGFVRLSGGLPNPGYSSEQGFFGTVYFKAKAPGAVEVKYLPSSMALANDGHGTNVLKELSSVSYLILPEKVPESSTKKSNISESGASGEPTQMRFYEENSVLGETTEKETEKEKNTGVLNFFLAGLQKVDGFILGAWTFSGK